MKRFGDEYRVVVADRSYARLLGARMIAIDGMPVQRAHELLLPLTPAGETQSLRDLRIADFMTMGITLHGTGITRDRKVARYTLVGKNGKSFTADVRPLKPDVIPVWNHAYTDMPMAARMPMEDFWCAYWPKDRTVYCRFRGYRDLATQSKELFSLIADNDPQKVVIDMRQNGGGDFFDGLRYVITPLAKLTNVNRRGHLFVLIDTATFSAAMSNAAQFRSQTHAILVGEPIGERPNSYQEVKSMTLPNSHWTVRYSTKFYKFVASGENVIRPDKLIAPTWPQYQAGRDPVLEWVLNSKG